MTFIGNCIWLAFEVTVGLVVVLGAISVISFLICLFQWHKEPKGSGLR
jgi:hypothetical protein